MNNFKLFIDNYETTSSLACLGNSTQLNSRQKEGQIKLLLIQINGKPLSLVKCAENINNAEKLKQTKYFIDSAHWADSI